jgi:hypothetical protein
VLAEELRPAKEEMVISAEISETLVAGSQRASARVLQGSELGVVTRETFTVSPTVARLSVDCASGKAEQHTLLGVSFSIDAIRSNYVDATND